MAAYATLADFYRYGLRAAAVLPQPRTVAAVDTSANALTLPLHGLSTADPVRIQAATVGGALPAPLLANVVYYAIAIDGDTLKLAATASDAQGGIAIDITTIGTGVVGLLASPEPFILGQLENDARVIDGALKAYGPPLVAPYPLEVVQINCWLSARNVAATLGMLTPAQATQDSDLLAQRYKDALQTIARWRSGEILPPGVVDQTQSVLENATVSEAAPAFECLELV